MASIADAGSWMLSVIYLKVNSKANVFAERFETDSIAESDAILIKENDAILAAFIANAGGWHPSLTKLDAIRNLSESKF